MIPEDRIRRTEVLSREETYAGRVWSIQKDEFRLGEQVITRDFLQHMGAVAVVAINEHSEVLLIQQYRHPVGADLVEIPAGLLDFPDEDPLAAAKRELLEEAGVVAQGYQVLVDLCTTPGSSSESVRIYLATGLTTLNWSATELHDEEKELQHFWVPLDECVRLVLAGKIGSPTACVGILALHAARTSESSLRTETAAWPLRQHAVETGRVFVQKENP